MRMLAVQRGMAILYPVTLVAVVLWAAGYHGAEDPAPRAALGFARHFIAYGLFHGDEAGRPACAWPAAIDAGLLEPGDIILGHNPHGVYGYWSHATLYLGQGQVLMQDITLGIATADLGSLTYYDEILITRPAAPAGLRMRAAQWARQLVGGVFNLSAHPRDLTQWTCAKSVWAAYRAQGVAVGDGRFWMTPDSLAADSGTVVAHTFGRAAGG